jgi:hypothetical protein
MIAKTHHMWSIYGSETAVSETAVSQLQNRSKHRILHSILQSKFRAIFVPFLGRKMRFFESFCTSGFDIQEITLTFTFLNGGARRKVH